MRTIALVALCTLGFVAACKRTDDGKFVIERPGEIDVKMKNDTLHVPSIGTVKDTVTTPSIGVQEETVIVKKPVIGSRKTEISKPVIKP
ncbi:MAG TPA: hypothetical protein VH080_09775 [Gemmatimonadaceae bacterium]|jgi:hypothetical protein|nr:hypothetical protein [Gemmatimonadaceae bacterium]